MKVSFNMIFKDKLNPKIWDNEEMKGEVRAKLKQIAKAFIEFLGIPEAAIKDIVVTGSMASYNYTEHSDIDLHVIVDPEKVHKNCPIVGEYLLSKKSEFNQKHDIYIYGIPVEVYAEVEGVGTIHNGLYSLNKGWVDLPKKIAAVNNDMAVKAKYEEYKTAAESIKDGELAEILLDKIKRMRKAGLAEGGEFSVENLVFKKLRDEGIIERLMKVKKEGIDKKLSLDEALDLIEEIAAGVAALGGGIDTGTSAMAPYANPLAGQEQPTKVATEGTKRQRNAQLGYRYQKVRNKYQAEQRKVQ